MLRNSVDRRAVTVNLRQRDVMFCPKPSLVAETDGKNV
jgi:hypothetical protein